jgi:predicted GNAT family acetyltransferase
MEILHQDSGREGRFYYQQDGADLAELVYEWEGPHKMIIDHTEVDDSLKGQGVGKVLVDRAAAYAREKGARIVPLCPYAAHVMQKGPEFKDVLWS